MADLTAGQMVMPYLYRGDPKLIELNDRIMAARYAAGEPLDKALYGSGIKRPPRKPRKSRARQAPE